MTDALDVNDRKERDRRDREARRLEREDLAALMSEAHGRRFMHRLLGMSGVFRSSYTMGDPHHTAFREGERNVGNRLLASLIEEHAELYALMLKENADVRS